MNQSLITCHWFVTNDCHHNSKKPMNSSSIQSSVRPNSLTTSIPRDMKSKTVSEKMQICPTGLPSAKAPVRRKLKTPGRWDAVMTKIEMAKTSNDSKTHKTALRGNYNKSGVPNGSLPNGSLPKIGPSDPLSVGNDNNNSSHLRPSTPSTPSHKSGAIPTMTKTNTLLSFTSKGNPFCLSFNLKLI